MLGGWRGASHTPTIYHTLWLWQRADEVDRSTSTSIYTLALVERLGFCPVM